MKKLLLFCAALACCINLSAAVVNNGIYYNVNTSDRTAEVVANPNGSLYSGDITIPSSFTHVSTVLQATFTVTGIAGSAFANCTGITSISLPNTLTYIGSYAFMGCTGISAFALPSSVDSIGLGAFTSTRFQTISMQDAGIGRWPTYFAMYDALLNFSTGEMIAYANGNGEQYYAVHSSCPKIAVGVFMNNPTLQYVSLPASLRTIENFAFYECNNLQVIISRSAEPASAQSGAFFSVPSGCTVYVPGGSKAAYETAAEWRALTISDDSIKTQIYDGIKYKLNLIGQYANVISNGTGAYSGAISIPRTVPFWGEEYYVREIEAYAFWGCPITSVSLPYNLRIIGDAAFMGCVHLASVYLDTDVSHIGLGAFALCPHLSRISVSTYNQYYRTKNGVLYTMDMDTLIVYPVGNTDTEYIIPEGVTTIGYGAFAYDTTLLRVEIPSSVKNIEISAFWHCTELEHITCKAAVPPTCARDAFTDVPQNLVQLHVPNAYADAYGTTEPWKNFSIQSSSTVTTTTGGITYNIDETYGIAEVSASAAKSGYKGVITIPDSVNYQGKNYAVKAIGEWAFSTCTQMTQINLPATLESINANAFFMCSGLTTITIPANVKYIDAKAFYHNSLTAFTVEAGSESFTTLDGVLYKANMQTLVACPGAKQGALIIPDGVLFIGDYAFIYCTGLTSITFPEGLYSIGEEAFEYCTGFTSFTLPASVSYIGRNAFNYCRNVITFVCHATKVPSLDGSNDPFYAINSNCILYVPQASISIYQSAAGWEAFFDVRAIGTGLQEIMGQPALNGTNKKVLHNGSVIILRGGKAYDLTGREIL